jgi:hypothetical protein
MEEKVISILRVQDAATAVAWYERLGFRETPCIDSSTVEHKGDAGLARSSTSKSPMFIRLRKNFA